MEMILFMPQRCQILNIIKSETARLNAKWMRNLSRPTCCCIWWHGVMKCRQFSVQLSTYSTTYPLCSENLQRGMLGYYLQDISVQAQHMAGIHLVENILAEIYHHLWINLQSGLKVTQCSYTNSEPLYPEFFNNKLVLANSEICKELESIQYD